MIRNVRLKVLSDPIVDSIREVVDRRRSVVLDAHRIAEDLFSRPEGATMDDVRRATGRHAGRR